MHKRSPFSLAQTHWLQPLIQFQPPSAGGAVQERTEYIDILVQSKLVSMLTNSNSEQCQCHRLIDLQQQNGFFSVIGTPHDTMGLTRRPTIAFQYFLFSFQAHQQIARVDWHFINLARVNQFRAHVKKDRLIIWIKRVNSLRLWDCRLNLGGEAFDPLPPVHFRNNRDRVSPHRKAGQNDDANNRAATRVKRKQFAAKPSWPAKIFLAESHSEQPARGHKRRHPVPRNRSRYKIDNEKRNERTPSQRFRKLSIFLHSKISGSRQRQKDYPWQEIKNAVRNVKN